MELVATKRAKGERKSCPNPESNAHDGTPSFNKVCSKARNTKRAFFDCNHV
jgi:hypothetical protein